MKTNSINKTYIILISLVSALGGFLFGYDWVVIGGAKPFYEPFFQIVNQPVMQGWAMSVALLGCLVGAGFSGILADRFGRKKLLMFAALIFIVSAYFTGAADTLTIFLLARLIGGIGIGMASNLSPMYIAEIAPKELRGKLVSLNQLTIVIGILLAQITNLLIADAVPAEFTAGDILISWNGQWGWRWMFWAVIVPSLIFLISLFFIPESPRWLAIKGHQNRASKILSKIGGEAYAINEMLTITSTKVNQNTNSLRILFHPNMRKVLVIGFVLAIFQQWSGINVIFNYAQEIFQSAGFRLSDVLFNIVVTGVANLVFTFVAIVTIEKLGRKALMLIGAGSLSLVYIILGICYYFQVSGWPMVFLVVLAIASYAMSLGPVTWVVLSEIFPNKIRGISMAFATSVLWIACFILTYTFPVLNATLKSSGTFWVYAFICILGFVFIYNYLPETKGKSLEEIEDELVK